MQKITCVEMISEWIKIVHNVELQLGTLYM
jgi:hypothetical protein